MKWLTDLDTIEQCRKANPSLSQRQLAAKLSLPLAYLNRELLLIDILDLNARARISAYANAVPSREISQNLVLALAGLRSLPDSPKLVSLALDRMLQGRFNSRQVRALINWTKAGNDPGEFAVAPVKEPKISPPAVAPRRPSGARGLWRGSPLATNPKFSSGRKLLHLASKAWSLARPALWWFAKQIMDFKPLKDGLKVSIAVTVFMVVVLGKQWFGSTLKSFLPSANVAMPNEAVRTPGSDGESLSAAKGLTRRRGEPPSPRLRRPGTATRRSSVASPTAPDKAAINVTNLGHPRAWPGDEVAQAFLRAEIPETKGRACVVKIFAPQPQADLDHGQAVDYVEAFPRNASYSVPNAKIANARVQTNYILLEFEGGFKTWAANQGLQMAHYQEVFHLGTGNLKQVSVPSLTLFFREFEAIHLCQVAQFEGGNEKPKEEVYQAAIIMKSQGPVVIRSKSAYDIAKLAYSLALLSKAPVESTPFPGQGLQLDDKNQVIGLYEGSPAHKAGIKPGHLVLGLGADAEKPQDSKAILAGLAKAGKHVICCAEKADWEAWKTAWSNYQGKKTRAETKGDKLALKALGVGPELKKVVKEIEAE